MNRELKFRAWNIPNKTMYIDIQNGVLCENEKGQLVLGVSFGTICKDAGSVIMQFTGLKDKNGREIYEGDILDVCNGSINGHEWKDKPYAVEYKPKGFDICMFCWDDDGKNIMNKTHWCEVIGNIYENPELLSE